MLIYSPGYQSQSSNIENKEDQDQQVTETMLKIWSRIRVYSGAKHYFYDVQSVKKPDQMSHQKHGSVSAHLSIRCL